MALSERLAIIITANGSGAISEFRKIETSAARSVGKAETTAGKFKANATRIGAGMAIVGAAVMQGMRAAYDEAAQAAAVGRQTDAVIKSTGGSANVTRGHLEDLAGSLSKLSAVDDEVIQSAGNVLLTFKAVRNEVGEGNDIFDRATESALDMSAALGVDMQAAAMSLGKALANPVQGLTMLRRAGVDFTAQQRDQIAAMVAVGDTLGAQKVIMDEVESQFDGQAEAAATGFARIQVAWGNMLESLGSGLESSGWAEWFAKGLEDPLERLKEYAREFSLVGQIIGEDAFIDTQYIEGAGNVIGELPPALDATASAAERAGSAVEELSEAIDLYLSGQFDIPAAMREAGESFTEMITKFTDGESTWADQGAAMQDYVTDVAGVINAMSEQGESQQAVDDRMRTYIGSLRAARDAGQITGEQFVTLRDQILGIPHGTETRVTTPGAREAQEEARRVKEGIELIPGRKGSVVELYGYHAVMNNAIGLKNQLDAIPKNVNVTVAIKNVGGPIPKAAGGSVEAGQLYLVGEEGPELAVFGQSGSIIPAGQTKSMMSGSSPTPVAAGGGGDIVINLDGETIARVVDRANRRFNMARSA